VEFDAYRSELEALKLAPRTEANILKQANVQAAFSANKAAYDKLRSDVGVKLQFLDENRVSIRCMFPVVLSYFIISSVSSDNCS